MNYKKVWYSPDSLNTSWLSYGGLYARETPDKKVYVSNGGGETLFYDFSLEVGDTVFFEDFPVGEITAIDSIMLLNNELRKRWQINLPNGGTWGHWIEGSGATYGFFWNYGLGP